ncbi:Copalyl diphosphate synthase-like protein [Purpureocillium lavendulum]|uniref:Copalyl diphosphate synthase-like protein n=1 Tax=Purpureocillium lavendulum TaxID=1247861 RepID=A0AB34FIT4_9HYPO|nr:Copalyl diphosphate synthase-like protein [Purpureocillium lavendulum]
MAARSSRQSAARTDKRRWDASEESTLAKAAQKRFEEGQTTLEEAEPYRILTAAMPVDALTWDWSLWTSTGNRPIQEKHVNTLCAIFQRGDMKRASYPLAVLSTRSRRAMHAPRDGLRRRHTGRG